AEAQGDVTLPTMSAVDRFADRLVAETYEKDEGVQLDAGDPSTAVIVPERLFARAQVIASASNLHLLPTIDIYRSTQLNGPQCEAMLEEIAFVASVSTDDLLREQLARMQQLVRACVLGRKDLHIEGP